MKKWTIIIKECGGQYREWRHNSTHENGGLRLSAAVERHFGKRAFFFVNNELTRTGGGLVYGQIFKPLPRRLGGGNTALTGRVYVEEIEHE